ncbi:hypothetical protein AVEN_150361-1 [Araneus ventricosus]|uniref:Uncharacterized protein n=1 Tax=Araneus ventricosus TaxID=182803 RepID=A0A4Y2CTD4_ARAVE|nr:hypothetical protein AVEN_150361-1 [Araneus ventricosus]
MVVLIETAWNGSPVSKHIEPPPVLLINNSLLVIGFDEMTPQNMKILMMTRGQKRNHHQQKKLCKPFVPIVPSNTLMNLVMNIYERVIQ